MDVFDRNGRLSPCVADVLYELGNIGVGKAIIPIVNIRQVQIRIGTPSIFTVQKDIHSVLEHEPGQIAIGVTTKMDQSLDGILLFLLSRAFVRNTIYQMTGELYGKEDFPLGEDSLSALNEMINYMTAGYAKMIGAYLQLPIYISSPVVGQNRVNAIVDDLFHKPMEGIPKSALHQAACVNTRFTVVDKAENETGECGHVLIFPNEACIEKFMELMAE